MLKILHCSDLHLDLPFHANTVEDAKRRRQMQKEVFSEIVSTALSKEVSLLLLPGDLWENAYLSNETVQVVLEEFRRLEPTCQVVISPGDADPYESNSAYARLDFPKNVHIFRKERLSFIDLPALDVRIYGYAFTDRNYTEPPLSNFTPGQTQPYRYTIFCGHGDLNQTVSSKAPILKRDLLSAGFDYAALGHSHRFAGVKETDTTRYAYCGAPEALSFDDCGAKSFLYLELEKDENGIQLYWEALSASPRHYEAVRLDVTGKRKKEDAIAALQEIIHRNQYTEHTALRAVFEGNVAPTFSCETNDLLPHLPHLLYLETQNETLPFADDFLLRQDIGIRGSFYRQLLPQLQSDDPHCRTVARTALQLGMQALEGEEISLADAKKNTEG